MAVLATLLLLGVVMSAQATTTIQVSPPQAAQPRDPTVKPVLGTGSISGKVIAADTGAPIRRAQVTLSGSQRPGMTYTDDEGRYSFKDLAASAYMLTVNPGSHRAAYLGAGYGGGASGPMTDPLFRPKPIELADGQQLDNINVSLVRGGAIVGTVTDASGEPAARVRIGALRTRRGMEPAMVGSFTTDDLGQFRAFGLAPGDYILMADARGFGGGQGDVQGETIGFAPTYAPGTPSMQEAMRVRLPPGGQAVADIRLIETRVFSVRGTVMSSSGELLRNASVSLASPDATMMMMGGNYGGGVMPDGTFIIRNVPPGHYELTATHMPGAGPGAGPRAMENAEMAAAPIEIGAADVEGIMLVTQRGATVAGEIVFDGGELDGGRVQVSAQQAERRQFIAPPTVDVKDTTFTIRNVFRRIVIRGSVIGRGPSVGESSWGLKAVLLNGTDITDQPRAFTNADSGKLQIVFTPHAPALEGTVTDDAGKPVEQYTVLAFGDDPATWRASSSMIRMGRPMKDGKFQLRGLREGRYRVVALPVDFVINPMNPDVELLEQLSKSSTPVVLNAGETRPLDLRLTTIGQ